MQSTSKIELSKSAIKHNLKFIKNLLGESVIFSSVVKGNAYGHGIEEMIPILQDCGVKHFAVFSADEAMRVKKILKGSPQIMIMGYIHDKDLEWVVDNNVEIYISDLSRAENLVTVSEKLNKQAIIHIDLETGMNRTGLNYQDLLNAIDVLHENKEKFYIRGVCTHLAGAESIANYVRIMNQIKRFDELIQYLKTRDIYPDIVHAASSASAIVYEETRFDMVRVGILQYGFWPTPETFIHHIHDKENKKDPLKRVLKWKSKVMYVKHIKQGEFIGYGNYFQAYNDMKIAIIPVGYYDGYSRSLSNQGKVLINRQRCSVIGMVNMNMIVADVSKLKNVMIGDEVVIIGKQGKHQLSVASFSELSSQINYELLTRLPMDITRIKTK